MLATVWRCHRQTRDREKDGLSPGMPRVSISTSTERREVQLVFSFLGLSPVLPVALPQTGLRSQPPSLGLLSDLLTSLEGILSKATWATETSG